MAKVAKIFNKKKEGDDFLSYIIGAREQDLNLHFYLGFILVEYIVGIIMLIIVLNHFYSKDSILSLNHPCILGVKIEHIRRVLFTPILSLKGALKK